MLHPEDSQVHPVTLLGLMEGRAEPHLLPEEELGDGQAKAWMTWSWAGETDCPSEPLGEDSKMSLPSL